MPISDFKVSDCELSNCFHTPSEAVMGCVACECEAEVWKSVFDNVPELLKRGVRLCGGSSTG